MSDLAMKQGDQSLTVKNATFEGVTALEHLGWKLEGRKPARVKREPKPEAPDVDAIRAEVEAELRDQIEAAVRAEFLAERDEAAAKAEEQAKAEAEQKEAVKAPTKK